ncbi:SDR family oxidoreductase [Micromonospora cremea]|uniref:SDR family oxidoreductase n=1 Tax=Micromonospora cremea TaxID=709881 RepID=UPI001FCB5CA4|nr:SDR family oxidoreductase [Micromonospora cremea]
MPGRVEDVATERRWPAWAASARATGAASSLSVALPIQEAVVGALNIYGRAPRALTEVVQLAQTFARPCGSRRYYRVTKAALDHLPENSAIINTASINGLKGNGHLIDYSATKGAIIALTYSLAQSLIKKRIRVNCVAPGPVWTPLIPATFPADKVQEFGQQMPMGRAAQPDEIAPSYVFFASDQLSSYYTGEVLAPIGGITLPD